MGNKSFRFKQFMVFHDKCAMKVGTDGVLLGAWAGVDNAKSILDVGTGTGLIALMLAQRNGHARITAIEIDADAAAQAMDNIFNSPFNDNIKVENISFHDFVATDRPDKFDAIVSNPPFFINSMLADDASRSNARHTHSLSLDDLLIHCKDLLNPNGTFSFIYPYDQIPQIEQHIINKGWHICRQTNVYPTKKSLHPKRILLEISLDVPIAEVSVSDLIIETARHQYSEEFRGLTQSFYLKM